jgi:dolichol-phosphate mannosyltransferase
MTKKLISICIPSHNEEANIFITYKKISSVLKKISNYNFEFIFVDNGSTDNTKKEIIKLGRKDKSVKGVFLSKNFGPESSGNAAFNYAKGDAVVSISADLQDPPELFFELIKKWENGSDLVLGVYKKNDDKLIMSIIRKVFYKIIKFISSIDFPENTTGFGLFDKKVVSALKNLPEKYRFARGLLAWVGFKRSYIYYQKRKRQYGKSSYNFFQYIKDAERGIFGFSYLVLDLMVYGGFILVFFAFLFIIGYLYTVIVVGNPINASIPIMLAIVFFGGIQLLAISIIGKYIQVIVEETKNRPMYIVEETINIPLNK